MNPMINVKENICLAGRQNRAYHKQGRARKPKPKIAVAVPLFFDPFQRQKEKAGASSVFQAFIFRVKGIKKGAKR